MNIDSFMEKVDDAVDKKVKEAMSKNLKYGVLLGEITAKEYFDISNRIDVISQYDLLVGIPAETSSRSGGKINNAELAFIHTQGVSKMKVAREIDKEVKKGMKYGEAREKVHAMWILEHGSPGYRIPPRPIIEPAIMSKSDSINKMLSEALKSFLQGDFEAGERKLKSTGMYAQNIVRGWFTKPENNWAPNAESTIKSKGSSRPLIDTGDLRKSITYVFKAPNKRETGAKTVKAENKANGAAKKIKEVLKDEDTTRFK